MIIIFSPNGNVKQTHGWSWRTSNRIEIIRATKKLRPFVPLKSWLFNRDPYNGLLRIPIWLGRISSPINPNQVFFHQVLPQSWHQSLQFVTLRGLPPGHGFRHTSITPFKPQGYCSSYVPKHKGGCMKTVWVGLFNYWLLLGRGDSLQV